MAAWKLAPALAAGCTIVLKPSSSTSLSVLELMHLIGDVLPPGVVNVITGKGSRAGQYILDHPDIQKLAFTGSTEIGRDVYDAAMKKLIPATLELGGKSANIYFDDCDWDMAMDGAQLGILFNQGQVCCAGSRIFVQKGIYDKFVSDLADRFRRIRVGLPWEETTQMGAQIDERQVKKILDYIEIGKQEGARLVCGGKKASAPGLEKGSFVEPTMLPMSGTICALPRKKSSGPSCASSPLPMKQKSSPWPNDSVYGLGGAVWTRDINRALRVAKAVKRAVCGSIRTMPCRQARPLAATSFPASAVKRTRRPCGTICRPRTSISTLRKHRRDYMSNRKGVLCVYEMQL